MGVVLVIMSSSVRTSLAMSRQDVRSIRGAGTSVSPILAMSGALFHGVGGEDECVSSGKFEGLGCTKRNWMMVKHMAEIKCRVLECFCRNTFWLYITIERKQWRNVRRERVLHAWLSGVNWVQHWMKQGSVLQLSHPHCGTDGYVGAIVQVE